MQSYVCKTPSKNIVHINAAVSMGLTVITITTLNVILVGVVAMRQRASRQRVSVNVRLDPKAPPEERHISSLQVTGYENPTYKYSEQSGTATASITNDTLRCYLSMRCAIGDFVVLHELHCYWINCSYIVNDILYVCVSISNFQSLIIF